MSIDVNVQNDLVIVTESSEDITVNVSNAPGPAGVGVPDGGTTGQVLKKFSNTNYDTYWASDASGLTSIGLSMPSAFAVSNSPLTSNGTIAVTGAGTASQYVRGDGQLDTFPSLTGFVPYTGATTNVDLGTHRILAQNATIASSGSGDTFTLNHSSGSGIGLNITKGGNGEGLYVNKTGGSGNAATIIGTLNATTLVKSGGTSSQFLKADGSVDSTTYVGGSGVAGQVSYWDGTSSQTGSNNLFWDAANSRLGIGTNTPDKILHIKGDNTSSDIVFETNTYTTKGYFAHYLGATLQLAINRRIDGVFSNTGAAASSINLFGTNGSSSISFFSTNTNNINPNEIMKIWGSGNITIQNGGTHTDNGSRLQVTGVSYFNGNVGIGTNSPTQALEVNGNILSSFNNFGFYTSKNNNHITQNAYYDGNWKSYGSSATLGSAILFQTDGTNSNALNILTDTSISAANEALTFTSLLQLKTNGNLLIGTTTDGGQRLQVQGDAFIKGSGATSATTALTVQNSAGNQLLKLQNDGNFYLNNSASYFYASFGAGQADLSGASLSFSHRDALSAGGDFIILGSNKTLTSSNASLLSLIRWFTPTSGTGIYNYININPTINQTGGANGITRGLYVNPTLTAAADWRSIEWSNNSGWGLYGAGTANNYLAGRLGIGTTSPAYILDVNTQARISGGSGIVGTIRDSSYALSLQNNASSVWIEMLNNGGAGKGVFLGLTSSTTANAFEQWNYQAGPIDFYTATTASAGSLRVRIANTGNLLLGGTTDGGQRLQNYGDTLMRGTLTVQNTSSQNVLSVLNNRRVGINNASPEVTLDVRGADAGIFLFRNAPEEAFINIKTGSLTSNSGVEFRGLANQKGFRFCDSVTPSNNYMQLWASGNLTIETATFSSYTDVASALLQVNSTTKGFLPPRMTTSQKTSIVSPVAGLQVYDTTLNQMSYYNGTTWINF